MSERVYLVATAPEGASATRQLRELAAVDSVGVHGLADDPSDATMLLFPDAHLHERDLRLSTIRHHPLVRQFPEKSVYDERDRPWRHLPGGYVSAPARALRTGYQVACAYYSIPDAGFQSLPDEALLFSFVGSPTARVREEIFPTGAPTWVRRAC